MPHEPEVGGVPKRRGGDGDDVEDLSQLRGSSVVQAGLSVEARSHHRGDRRMRPGDVREQSRKREVERRTSVPLVHPERTAPTVAQQDTCKSTVNRKAVIYYFVEEQGV